jgi:hypothetical protein
MNGVKMPDATRLDRPTDQAGTTAIPSKKATDFKRTASLPPGYQ